MRQASPAINPASRRATRASALQAAAFLDRDGVLIEDLGYVASPDRLRWMPDAVAAVAYLRARGFLVFVVTNQSGVARGFFDEADVDRLHAVIQQQVRAAGTSLDAVRYCPHHPAGAVARFRTICSCRKPAPGLLLDLIAEYDVDRAASLMIGDKATDLAAGEAAGVAAHLFRGGSLLRFVETLVGDRPAADGPS